MQTTEQILAAVDLWQQRHAPADFIQDSGSPDEQAKGTYNASRLAQIIRDSFGGVYSPSNLTDALIRFRGQFHWREPVQAQQPAEPTAEQLADQEAARRYRADQDSRRRFAKEQADARNSGRKNHADKSEESESSVSPSAIIKGLQQKAVEDRAKRECESLTVSRPNGRPDHFKTQELRKAFAYNADQSVNWLQTWKIRNQIIDGHSKVERDRVNQRDRTGNWD